MRIALLTPAARIDGGVAVHVQRSANALREAGHQVLVLSGDEPACEADVQIAGLAAVPLSAGSRRKLRELLREHQVQVAHFHDVNDAAAISDVGAVVGTVLSAHGWYGCAPGTRYFGHGHECKRAHGPLCVPNMLLRNCKHRTDPRWILPYYRRAEENLRALKGADVAVAHSGAVADHLANNRVVGARIVPLPVDGPDREPSPATGGPRVAYVGRLTPVKGVAILLKSATHFDAHIDICGSGFIQPKLERMAERLGLSDRVTFHGWRSAAEVETIYSNARIVVVPSVYPEPFGMVGPEAMLRGRPVVASSTGGTSDWLEHGITGLAVAPGDPKALGRAVATLLGDSGAAARMGRAGRMMVLERFSAEAHVQSLLAVYRESLDRSSARHAAQQPGTLNAGPPGGADPHSNGVA